MEDIVPGFNGTGGWSPMSFQELQEALDVNQPQSPAYNPYQTLLFNQEHVPDVSYFGLDIPQQFHPPAPFVVNGTTGNNSSHSAGSSKWSLGEPTELTEDGTEIQGTVWARIKWTHEMVKTLINAVSYASSDDPENEKYQSPAPVRGKWRAVSNAMIERSYFVSPQQCEDKLNDLGKKYKRLCDLLGENTALNVVQDPALLESINISDEAKNQVKKILTCRQLFFQEMCSYRNRDRKYLPDDIALQKVVQSGLKGKVNTESQNLIHGMPAMKKQKQGEDNRRVGFFSVHSEGVDEVPTGLEQGMISPALLLEQRMLKLQKLIVEFEKQKFETLKRRQKEDRAFHLRRLELESMKYENQRLVYEAKRLEDGGDRN